VAVNKEDFSMINMPDKQVIAARTMLGWNPPNGFENRLEHSHVAVVALVLADALIPEVIEGVTEYVTGSIQPDGGLNDGTWPASEMECAYSGIRALMLCDTMDQYPEPERLTEWVLSKQNPDGGFGALCDWGQIYTHEEELADGDYSVLGFHQESSSHACFFAYGALEALEATEQADLSKLSDYLVSQQRTDGGWSFYPTNEQGSAITTAMALHVLDRLGSLDRIDRDKAIEWLLACQREDGSFDGYPGLGRTRLQYLYTARASKALRILNAFHQMNLWGFERYWNQQVAGGGWNLICLGMATGIPLVLQER
jgi:prenyltransferase beta subunit